MSLIQINGCDVLVNENLGSGGWSIDQPTCSIEAKDLLFLSLLLYSLLSSLIYYLGFAALYGNKIYFIIFPIPIITFFVALTSRYKTRYKKWERKYIPVCRVEAAYVITELNPRNSIRKWKVRFECKITVNCKSVFVYPDDSDREFVSETSALNSLRSVIQDGSLRVLCNPRSSHKFLVDW